MGTRIKSKGTSVEDTGAKKYSAAVRRGLKGIHFLNKDKEKIQHNFGPDNQADQGSVVGSPTITASYASLKGRTNYVQSGIAESDEMTVFCIARSSDTGLAAATRPSFLGTQQGAATDGGTSDGINMYMTAAGSGTFSFTAAYGNNDADRTNLVCSISWANRANFALFVATINSAGITFRDVTNNRTNTVTPPAGLPRRRSTNKLRIGSAFNAFDGFGDVVLIQAHNVVLTTEEKDDTIAQLRRYAASKGITV
ncbi:hypothetical protein [Pseudomonas putida]|uniref:Uncharacterized protein n=1 Tax=Pseudomonas putida TaxID=303 RepID=A0A8I1EIP4_PSEPU|nr:hypothetical protein [Pseudomonas putida]MBI6886445.1 hypothetical protein [Pseudomonas putida]